MVMKRQLLIILVVKTLVISQCIFPAARFERYTANSDVILVVNPHQFDIVHTPSTPEVDAFLQAAKECYLDFFFPNCEPEQLPKDGGLVHVSVDKSVLDESCIQRNTKIKMFG